MGWYRNDIEASLQEAGNSVQWRNPFHAYPEAKPFLEALGAAYSVAFIAAFRDAEPGLEPPRPVYVPLKGQP